METVSSEASGPRMSPYCLVEIVDSRSGHKG
jgi:hypothetical protein